MYQAEIRKYFCQLIFIPFKVAVKYQQLLLRNFRHLDIGIYNRKRTYQVKIYM